LREGRDEHTLRYPSAEISMSSDAPQRADATPLRGVEQLVDYFAAGRKPLGQHRLGLEHEKIAVLADASAPDHKVIERILKAFVGKGWTPMEEAGNVIGARHPAFGSFTLEPGGQLEHSGAPHASVREAVADNDRHLDELTAICEGEGVRMLATGFRPFNPVEAIPWMPKGRYVVMRDYLPRHGRRAHDMMKRTATVQANVDYVDEADAIDKLRLGQSVSPLVTALFAASPLADGKDTGEQSYRASAWLETDPARCGLLPFLFAPGASFAGYANWALDVPMFFVYRDGQYRSLAGEHFTFRRFIAEGHRGARATLDDWEVHLSTLFPDVRLKRYIEVRQADASTRPMMRALPSLWRGIFASDDTRQAAFALVSSLAWDERLRAQREVPRLGLRAELGGRPLQPLVRALVEIAARGLRAAEPEVAPWLEPLEEIAVSGRTVADRILERYREAKGDPTRLIAALAL
jgi:glutamate--cysteine ligase